MSNRQRYFLRHRKGGKTSIYLGGVAKDILALEEKYTSYVKSLVAEGVSLVLVVALNTLPHLYIGLVGSLGSRPGVNCYNGVI